MFRVPLTPMEYSDDPRFGVEAAALKLIRSVEMYQWVGALRVGGAHQARWRYGASHYLSL